MRAPQGHVGHLHVYKYTQMGTGCVKQNVRKDTGGLVFFCADIRGRMAIYTTTAPIPLLDTSTNKTASSRSAARLLGRLKGHFRASSHIDVKKTRLELILIYVGRIFNHHNTFHNAAAIPDAPLPCFVAPKATPCKNTQFGSKMTRIKPVSSKVRKKASPCLRVYKKAYESC